MENTVVPIDLKASDELLHALRSQIVAFRRDLTEEARKRVHQNPDATCMMQMLDRQHRDRTHDIVQAVKAFEGLIKIINESAQ